MAAYVIGDEYPSWKLRAKYNDWLRKIAEEDFNQNSVHSICAHLKYKEKGIIQCRDLKLKALEKETLLRRTSLSTQCGYASTQSDRDELRSNCHAVQDLGDTIVKVEWSHQESIACYVCAMYPGKEHGGSLQPAVCRGLALSARPGSMNIVLACGHNNYAMCVVLADRKCFSENPKISKNKKLNLEVIWETDPFYADAIGSRLKWSFGSEEVRGQYFIGPEIIQGASNVHRTIQQKQSCVQGMMQVSRIASSLKKTGQGANCDLIKKMILKSRLPSAELSNPWVISSSPRVVRT